MLRLEPLEPRDCPAVTIYTAEIPQPPGTGEPPDHARYILADEPRHDVRVIETPGRWAMIVIRT